MSRAIDSTGQLLAVIVERSQPDPNRTPPPGAQEEVLRDLDRRSAQCYADLELKSHRFRKLAAVIAGTDAGEDETPVEYVAEEDSLVIHIEEVAEVMRPEKDDD